MEWERYREAERLYAFSLRADGGGQAGMFFDDGDHDSVPDGSPQAARMRTMRHGGVIICVLPFRRTPGLC